MTSINGVFKVLLAMLALCSVFVLPAMAATEIQLTAHNLPVFSMQLQPQTIDMGSLAIGDNVISSGTPICTVTTNSNYQITAYDSLPSFSSYGNTIVDAPGYLKEFDASGNSPTGLALKNKLNVRIGDSGSWNTVSASPTLLHSGTPGSFTGTTAFKQVLDITDHPSSTNIYRIWLTFDGAPTA